MHDAQRLARRQPALFVGGAFALGLLGARFLKSSSPEHRYAGYSGERDLSSGSGFAERGQAGRFGTKTSTNPYGNRVPSSATSASSRSRQASVTSRDRDYSSTEEM